MTRPPILPLLAALLGLGILSSSGKAEAKTNGSGSSGGGSGGGTGTKLPPPPHDLEVPALFTVRSGDLPAGVAAYYGGSVADLQHENPGMQLATAAQQIATGWNVGKKVILPAEWRPFSKPLPKPGGFNPKPTNPPQFPEPIA